MTKLLNSELRLRVLIILEGKSIVILMELGKGRPTLAYTLWLKSNPYEELTLIETNYSPDIQKIHLEIIDKQFV